MAVERTFSIIKPDATERNLTGAIERHHREGRPAHRRAEARAHHRANRPRRSTACTTSARSSANSSTFMISAPVVVQVLEGENAIAKYRDVMGATDPAKAADGYHPQGARQVDRRELGAWFGRAGDGGASKSPSSSPATRSWVNVNSETWR